MSKTPDYIGKFLTYFGIGCWIYVMFLNYKYDLVLEVNGAKFITGDGYISILFFFLGVVLVILQPKHIDMIINAIIEKIKK